MSKDVRFLRKALCAPALLAAAAVHTVPAVADVIANDITLSVPDSFSGSSSGGTLTFNITEQSGLVDGTSRPVQLLSINNEGGDFARNCITVSVPPFFSGSSSFTVNYTVVEGGSDIDLNLIDTASGSITFVPSSSSSSTQTVVEAIDQSCGDVQFNPVAAPDVVQASANQTTAITVLANDLPQSLPGRRRITFGFNQGTSGLGEARLILQSTTAQGGTVVARRDTGTILYTPAPGFVGQDTFQYTLADYVVQGFEGLNTTSTVAVSVTAAPAMASIVVNGTPAVNGGTLSVPDSDGQPGETVTFDGSQSSTGSGLPVTNYAWFLGNSQTPAQSGPSPSFAPRLADGSTLLRLEVRDSQGNVAQSSLTVTVGAMPSVQIMVNGRAVSAIADTDFLPGEKVRFDASQSTSSTGAPIVQYDWFVGDASEVAQSGASAQFETQLPDGQSTIRLVVMDANEVSGTASLTVTINSASALADMQNLTPNQAAVAQSLDRVCTDLAQRNQAQALSGDQADLLARCQGVLGTDNLAGALDELSAQDFNGARTQALLFTNAIYAGVQDRLMALRGGARGVSFAGLNVVIDGKSIPVAQIQDMLGTLLGGGAAADDEPGSLLGDKWGTWTRGNFTFGTKDRSSADQGFEADQFSLVVGLDYRMSDRMVLGSAISFGSANVAYNPNAQGGIDTKSIAASFYGSRYVGKHYYVDGVFNVASSSYDAERRITYMEGANSIDRTAKGDTSGLTLSGGVSGGYDYSWKALSVTPNVGVFYSTSNIDAFKERGAQGLNLRYEEQNFQSLTANLGVRTSYTVSLPWGVLIPYIGGDYVRELQRNVEVFNVRFASDPANPTPPIEVRANNPDQSYFRLTGGLSAQFPFGISGYVEYQRLQNFEFVHFTDLAMGLRMQYSW